MKRISICVVAGLALVMTGCIGQAVPKTTISGSIAGAPFALSSPKDSDLAGLDVSAETNGAVRIHIDRLTAKMSPDVITTTGQAQAALIKAVADGVASGLGTAAGTAAASAIGK